MILKGNRLEFSQKVVFVFVIGFIVLSGCSNDNNRTPEEDNVGNDYAPSSNDVVDEQGDITNLDLLEDFIENVEEGIQDNVRVVRYSTEGDPILQDLEYDKEKITVTTDSTRDQYGDGEVSINSCKLVNKNNTVNRTEYILKDCENPDRDTEVLFMEQ